MGSKGSNTTTQTTAPDSQAMEAYRALLARATNVASQPYSPYGGELTAGINTQQQAGIGNINQYSGWAQPYMQQAAGYATQLGQGPSAEDIARYQSPYTQQVVNATQAQFARSNAAQQNDLRARAAAAGALGGNAAPIAAADMAYQQQQGQAPVIAGLYARSYDQALQAWQQGRGQAAGQLSNIGVAGQQAGLAGAGAQLGAGTVQQQNEQQRLNALYQQYQMAQAFPYQQTQWLAGVQTGVGSQMGGTGTTTAPAPNPWGQIAGLGLTALSFANRGGRIRGFAVGGEASQQSGVGASPYGNIDWLPQIGLTRGRGAPEPPRPQEDKSNPIKDAMGFARGLQRNRSGVAAAPMDIRYDAVPTSGVGDIIPSFTSPWAGVNGNPIYRRGGGVRGYQDAGAVYDDGGEFPDDALIPTPVKTISYPGFGGDAPLPFEERWAPTKEAVGVGDFDPRGDNNSLAYSPDLREPPKMPVNFPGAEPPADVPQTRGVAGPPPGWIPAPREGSPDARPIPRGVIPPRDIPDQGAPPAAASRSGLFGLGIPSEYRMPMLTAGLAMMANRSPHLGVALGEAGLAGVGAYVGQQNKAQERAFEEKKFKLSEARLDNETRRLDQAAKMALENLKLGTRRVEAIEARTEAENWRPTGTMTEDGQPIVYNTKTGEHRNGITKEPIKPGEKIKSAKDITVSGLTPTALDTIAERILLADPKAIPPSIGRDPQGRADVRAATNRAYELGEKRGMSPAEIAKHIASASADWQGRMAGERTLGVQESKMGTAGFEAKGAINLARGIIDKVPRTGFLPFNQLIELYKKKTLNPDQAELFTRTQGVINAYAAVMARGANVTTDASRHRAEELLQTAFDAPTYKRVLETMESEIDMALNSPERMRQFYRQRSGEKAFESAPKPDAAPPPAAAAPAAKPARVKQNGHTYELQPDGKYKAID